MNGTIKSKGFGMAATLLLAALLIAAAFVPAMGAVEDTKDKESGRGGIILTIPISGYLSPPNDTDDFPFYVPSGECWNKVTADVPIYNIHIFDRFNDISIELVDPDGNKVDGDKLWFMETHLNLNYKPGSDLKTGMWHIYVKGEGLNGEAGYDGAAPVFSCNQTSNTILSFK